MSADKEIERTILIEATSARAGGGRTYLQELFRHYQPQDGVKVVAIVPAESRGFFNVNDAVQIMSLPINSNNVFLRWIWLRFSLARLLRILEVDCVFFPGGTLSVSRGSSYRVVTACQNMLPFDPKERARYRLGYMRLRLFVLRYLQLKSFRRADQTIFLSVYAREKIRRLLGNVSSERFLLIPHGVPRQPITPQEWPRQISSIGSYVLYVSTIDVYKAQIEVVRAWGLLRDSRPTPEKLLLIGSEYKPYGRWLRHEIKELGLQNEVLILGEVPRQELFKFYSNAQINLFASSCENGPITLLEAMSAGRCVLCSNVSPMPEFGEDAVLYFNPYAPKELAALLKGALENERMRASYGVKALIRAQKYDVNESCRQTWEVLLKLAEENG